MLVKYLLLVELVVVMLIFAAHNSLVIVIQHAKSKEEIIYSFMGIEFIRYI